MLTYFLVLLIPLALSGYSYFASYRIIEREVQTSNATSLKLMSSTLDQQVETASNIGNQLLSEQRLKQFINMQTPENYRTTYQTELIKLLTSYCRNAAISDITLYLPELDYCVTARSAESLKRLYSGLEFTRKDEIPLDEWRSLLSELPAMHITSSSYLSYNNFGSKSLVYAVSNRDSYSKNSYIVNIFISIRLDNLDEILTDKNVSSLLIMERDGTPIENLGAPLSSAFTPSFDPENSYQTLDDESGEFICSYVPSTISGLVYAAIAPKHLYWNAKYSFTTVCVISITLACIIGISLSLYLLYKNYLPLNSLLQSIADTETAGPASLDEYDLISQRFQKINLESVSIKDQNLKQHSHLEEAYLRTVLMGTNWETLDDVGMTVEERMEGKTLALVAVYAMNKDASLLASEDGRRVSLAFLFDNVLDELLQFRFAHEKTGFQDVTVFLFTLEPQEVKDFEEQIAPALTELRNFFAQNLALSVQSVIGNYAVDSSQLCDVYQQVKLTHAQDSAGTAVLWASSNDRPSVENLAMDAFVEPLCEAVRQLSWNDARYISDALFRTLYESSKSYTELQFYIIAAVARLQDIHAAAGNGGPDQELLDEMQRLAQCRDLESLRASFQSVLKLLCDRHTDENPAADEGVYLRVQRYVHQNYSDVNLSLAKISEDVDLSPKYLSRLFKIQTGKRLPDYIAEVRIAKAKELIAQGDLTLNAIAEQVGFGNIKTFRRTFQKIENMNPAITSYPPTPTRNNPFPAAPWAESRTSSGSSC